MIKTGTVTAPAHWASALINGDLSSLNDDAINRFEAWNESLLPAYVVDVVRNDNGEAQEPWFTNCYYLYDGGGPYAGGEVLDYVTHEQVMHGISL